jgi:hypothetical protein
MRTMGAVICETHGRQFGQVACEHVVLSVHRPQPLEGEVVEFTVDYRGDRGYLLSCSACAHCAQIIAVTAGGTVSNARADESDFPRLILACSECYREWRAAR